MRLRVARFKRVRLYAAIVLAAAFVSGGAQAQAPDVAATPTPATEAPSSETHPDETAASEAQGSQAQPTEAHAAESETTVSEAQTPPSEIPATASDAEDEIAEAPMDETRSHEPQVDLRAASAAQLDSELAQVQAERDELTRFWALLVLGTGLAALVAASSVGIGTALSCEDSCDSAAWIGPTVLVGMGLATIGAVGLVATDHDIEQVELRRSHIERQRQAVELSRGISPRLSVRVTF